MSVLVRTPSKVRGYFLEASLYTFSSSFDSLRQLPGLTLADLPTNQPHSETDTTNRPRALLTSSPHYIILGGAGIFNLLPITYAFQPLLRVRLTQGRRALPWKPWIFGEEDSHLLYRLLMPCILTCFRSSTPHGIPSTQKQRSPTT